MNRTCSKCGVEKPLNRENFHVDKSRSGGFRKDCRVCHGAIVRTAHVRYEDEDKFGRKLYKTLNKYQLTPPEFLAQANRQKGVCIICGKSPSGERLLIDHDHSHCSRCKQVGKSCRKGIRGLVCHSCNLYIGSVENDRGHTQKHPDRPERIRAVRAYLNDPPWPIR